MGWDGLKVLIFFEKNRLEDQRIFLDFGFPLNLYYLRMGEFIEQM